MRKTPRFWIGISILVVLFLIIIGYSYNRTRDLFNGPIIVVTEPQNNETVHNKELTLTGNIKNAISVTLNDRKIFLDEKGNFNEKLLLAKGYTIITIKAEDRFNRTAEKKLEVVFNSDNS